MSSPTRRISASLDDQSRTRILVKEFLSCQHLLSNEDILEFLSGEEQESGDRDNNSPNDHDRNECLNNATWKRHNDYSCHEQLLLRQAYVLFVCLYCIDFVLPFL
jgi:hypothetical protein